MRISDWSSDVCSSDLDARGAHRSTVPTSWCSSSRTRRGPKPKPMRSTPTYRSEEHTSELQSLMRISYAVFCLKKKQPIYRINRIYPNYNMIQLTNDPHSLLTYLTSLIHRNT